MSKLTIEVYFDTGIEMENNLNKAIDELGAVLKKKGLMEMELEGRKADNLVPMYGVTIKIKQP